MCENDVWYDVVFFAHSVSDFLCDVMPGLLFLIDIKFIIQQNREYLVPTRHVVLT